MLSSLPENTKVKHLREHTRATKSKTKYPHLLSVQSIPNSNAESIRRTSNNVKIEPQNSIRALAKFLPKLRHENSPTGLGGRTGISGKFLSKVPPSDNPPAPPEKIGVYPLF